MTRARDRAVLLLMRVVPDRDMQYTDPIGYWDRYASGCDARTAIGTALGIPVDLINPARGTAPMTCFEDGAA